MVCTDDDCARINAPRESKGSYSVDCSLLPAPKTYTTIDQWRRLPIARINQRDFAPPAFDKWKDERFAIRRPDLVTECVLVKVGYELSQEDWRQACF